MQVSFAEFGGDALPLSGGAVPGRIMRIYSMQSGERIWEQTVYHTRSYRWPSPVKYSHFLARLHGRQKHI